MSENKAIKILTDDSSIEKIIYDCQFCHVSMIDNDKPYIVGMNFGYKDKTIYLHSAKSGKKIEILQKNNNVSIFFTTGTELFARHQEVACSWRMRYKSVVANGKADFLDDYEQKLESLKIFMNNYADNEIKFSKPAIDNILIIKIKV
jgi:nitroimidazol reductase NimA-like FMN-containing flavoprotein (pyridoxamine 5'-phosphate oxidase superfamily)